MCSVSGAENTCAAAMAATETDIGDEKLGSEWTGAYNDDRVCLLLFVMFFAIALAGYACTSYVFLRTPTLIFKRKDRRFPARHISHRGGAGEATENTLEAYERALKVGTQLLELDVHLTKDDQVVVVHDLNLNRLAGIDVDVSDFRYEDLPFLNRQLAVSFSKGKWNKDDQNRKIPLLKDVFERFPNVPVNIDIKVNNDRLITETARLISEYKREHLTVWGNASKTITDKCYKENPSVGLLFSARRVIQVVLLYYTGLLPFVPLKETHLEIPMPNCLFNFMPNPSKKSRLFIAVMDKFLMRRGLFEHLQKRGIPVYLWVLNEPDDWDRAFDELGVDGVMTDFPSKLAEYLKEKDAKSASSEEAKLRPMAEK